MDFSQIRPIALLAITFLNCAFTFFVWLKGKSREAYHLGWLTFFSALYSLSWAAVFSFPNKLFWTRMTWIGFFLVAANMIFIYCLTEKTEFFKLKSYGWYALAIIILIVSLTTPYIIKSVSNDYPVITPDTAGPLNQLVRILTVLGLLASVYYIIVSFRKNTGLKKLRLKYVFTGILIYIFGSLLFAGILPLFSASFFFFLDAPAYFSVIWLGLATYAIIKKELFDIKIILTELFVALIGLILFGQIFLMANPRARIIGSVIFLLFCFLGYLLIRTTYREIQKEQEAAKLATDLSDLNETLENKIREKTQELRLNVAELTKSKIALTATLAEVRQTRHQIEEEHNKTIAIIVNFADGLLVFDHQNTLTLMNPRAEIFLKISAAEAVGKKPDELGNLPFFKSLFELLDGNKTTVFRQELTILDLTLEISSVPIFNAEGQTDALIILHDVTREKRIEKMKTEFVSVAAHQLRTPLSAIKWALSLLLEGDLGKLNAEQKDFVKKSYASNQRMIILIDDLLNVAKIEEGKYVYNLRPADMAKLVQDALNACKELSAKRKIKITQVVPDGPITEIKVDAEKITIAMQNLIENAIKYTMPGGQVTISLKYDTNNIEFSVADTGVGISPEQQKRLFTKFFRAANVMLMETDGTGLGLFIAKNIIEAHNGKIWFKSAMNKGSAFYFSLPSKQKNIESKN